MKKIFLVPVMLLFLLPISCKDRFETIGTIPTFPKVKIFYLDSLLSYHRDSIKLSNPNFSYFGVDLRLSDSDRYYTSLSYSFTQGGGKFVDRSDTLTPFLLPFINFRCQLQFLPYSPGETNIIFLASDQLHNSSSATLSLFTFTNLLPISILKLTPLKTVDPLEYSLDASSSYDQDRHFGGAIVQYIYQVEGQTILTSQNQIKYIFSAPGVYTVTLQTKDNDGAFSSINSQQVSIN